MNITLVMYLSSSCKELEKKELYTPFQGSTDWPRTRSLFNKTQRNLNTGLVRFFFQTLHPSFLLPPSFSVSAMLELRIIVVGSHTTNPIRLDHRFLWNEYVWLPLVFFFFRFSLLGFVLTFGQSSPFAILYTFGQWQETNRF